MKKITFYGKDFSPISEAKMKTEGLSDPVPMDKDNSELLRKFVEVYGLPKEDSKDNGSRLSFYANNIMFGKWVGVFRKKNFEYNGEIYDVTLEIRCRFDTDEKAFFLAAMLCCPDPKELETIKPEVNITFHSVMDIFLLFMFRNQLANASKKGILRRYQRFENNDSRPHGSIDIARHIRENMGLKNGKIAYNYRELTANNPVNRLILAAYDRLREKYPKLCDKHITNNESVFSTLKTLQTEIGFFKTNARNIVKENLRPITHPFFSEYEDLRKTCLKILRDENVWIFDADCFEETDAICFDITRLWEEYLEYHFKSLLKKQELKVFELETQRRYIFLNFAKKEIENKKGAIKKEARPDFLFKKGGQNYAVLDAKFKNAWEEREHKYLTADIDECIRNLAVFWTYRTGVIYPTESTGDVYVLNIFGNETGEVEDPPKHFLRFDVVKVAVPETGELSFEDWLGQLNENVSEILSKYLEQLKS